ncbi:MAG: T9SS type A sorting domain-containing protein [Bacteroidales bacterium]|nr:T9SS type A sorting domain-containing protein [Bacteroidales bacterium]
MKKALQTGMSLLLVAVCTLTMPLKAQETGTFNGTATKSTPYRNAIVIDSLNPYHEGFEFGPFDDWSYEIIAGTCDWHITDGVEAYEGNHYAYFTWQRNQVARIITPVFDMSNAENATLTFAHSQEADGSNQDILEVYYRSSDSDNWHVLAVYESDIPTYVIDTFELQDLSATYQLSFVGNGNYGMGIYVDNINIVAGNSETPVVEPCEVPANIAVENNVVTWGSEAANFNLMIVANGDTTHATAAGNTYTVEGLENGTEVVVLVQAICDEDNLSDWTEGFTFTYETTGINNYSINVKVYPNPTTGLINVDCAAINADVTVYDMFGKLMMTSKIANERTELDFSAFAPGMYIVRIADANNSTNVKVVKE